MCGIGSLGVLENKGIELISEDGTEVVPGVKAILTPGHTPGV